MKRLRATGFIYPVVMRSSKPFYVLPSLGTVAIQNAWAYLNQLTQTYAYGSWHIGVPRLTANASKRLYGASPNLTSLYPPFVSENSCGRARVSSSQTVYLNAAARLSQVANGRVYAATSTGLIYNGVNYTAQPTEDYVRPDTPEGKIRLMLGNFQADKLEYDGDDLIVYVSLSDVFGRGTLSWTTDELVTEVYQENGEWKARGERLTVTAEIYGEHWT